MNLSHSRGHRITALLSTILLVTMLFAGTSSRLHAAPLDGQHYVTPDGLFTLTYPDGWTTKASGEGNVVFANDPKAIDAALGSSSPVLKPGQTAIEVEYVTPKNPLPSSADITNGPQALLSSLLKSGAPFKFGPVRAGTLGTVDMASATLFNTGFEGIVYAFFEGKTPFLVVYYAAPNEAATNQSLAEALIQSIAPVGATSTAEATTPATMQATQDANSPATTLGQTVTTPDKKFKFNYPTGWVTKAVTKTIIAAATSQGAIDAVSSSSGKLKSGDIIIQVQYFPKKTDAPSSAVFDAGPVGFLKSMVGTGGGGYTYSDAQAIRLGTLDAARVDIKGPGIVGVAYGFFIGDVAFLVASGTVPGELDSNIPLIESIVQSIKPADAIASTAATPAATLSATLSATQSAAGTGTIDLSQKYTFSDYVMQLNYPKGWITKKISGFVVIANSDAALAAATSSSAQMPSGGVAILVRENLFGAANLTNDDLTNILKSLMPDPKKLQLDASDPQNIKIGDKIDAIQITEHGSQLDAVGYAFKLSKATAFMVVAGTASGELDANIPTIEAIIQTIGFVK